MKRIVLAVVIVLLLAGMPVLAQDGSAPRCTDEEINGAVAAAQTTLGMARGADALTAAAKVSQDLMQLYARCRPVQGDVATASGTRTDPIPLGQYFSFDSGIARIAVIEDPAPQTLYGLDPGMRGIGLAIEYVCQESDPNTTCKALDVLPGGIVLVGGQVIDRAFVMAQDDTVINWGDQEAFAGNTLTGVDFLAAPEGVQIEAIEVLIGFNKIYFSPQ